MHFCYVDESGDCGGYDALQPGKSGSRYFILSGLVVPSSFWKASLELLKAFRRKLDKMALLPSDLEFHCSEMIDPHKIRQFTAISVADRWSLIEQYAETIGTCPNFSIISVVVDKMTSSLPASAYLTTAVTSLYQAFDELLRSRGDNGMVLLDRANEKQINSHVRNLLGTGVNVETIPAMRMSCIIEDPVFRVSSDSLFIQSADVIAYTLKEKEFPQTSRQKHHAHKIFTRKLRNSCYCSKMADEDGIIRK